MGQRLELHRELESIPNVQKAYFQPPTSDTLVYPCIEYRLRNIDSKIADNKPYLNKDGYEITIIDRDPDSQIRQYFMNKELCRFDRFYTADGLNHWVFVLYY